MTTLNYNGIIRGTVIRSMQVLGYGANPDPTPPGPTPLQVSASVRFNTADTAGITFMPQLQGSRTTWTWSGWIKRSSLGVAQYLMSVYNAPSNYTFQFQLMADNTLEVFDYNAGGAGSYLWRVKTTQVFRDPSSWYHIQISIDTTQATAANRVSIYVNGVLITALAVATYPSQYFLTNINVPYTHYIGSYVGSTTWLGAYLADINFVDGQALTPSSFTETDTATGQIIPMTYAGSYGTNGFYLPFGNSATVTELGLNPKATGQDYPYWPYNTLLINSSSANSAQNNTFLDSSTNAFTITRNGNTTQGNFTPFNYGGGTTQTDGYYSSYFDGTGDFANVSGSGTSINFGTNDFTIEAWFNVSTLSTAFYLMDTCPLGVVSPTNRIIIRVNTDGALQYATFQGVSVLITSFNAAISTNRWNHFALVKSSGSTKLYLNGIQVGNTYADSLNYPAQINRPLLMGDGYGGNALGTGYISNLRIVKGTAVYTSNFTVPTTPLTAIANTSLLTCQSSQFIDNSASAASITLAGNTQPVPTNPFGTTFSWSGCFDGSGDFLTIPGSSAFNLSSGSWTVECWFYQSSSKQVQVISSGAARWRIDINTSQQVVWLFNTTSSQTSNNTAPLNQWNHVAVCYNGTTVVMYLNGIAQTATGSLVPGSDNTSTLYIGRNPDAGGTWDFGGNISNARIVKGTAVYTANFTPPTAPLTAIPGTQLLTCQSSTFVDNSPNAFAITVNGNAFMGQLNFFYSNPINSTPPVQAWSNYFEGTSASVGGGLTFPSSSNFAMGTGDFTVEAWYRPTRAADASTPMSVAWYIGTINGANAAGGGVATNQIHYRAGGSSNQISLVTNVTGWNHIAWVRQNGVIYVYLNGIRVASAANTTSISAGTMIVARPGTDTFRFSGNLSNMRVVKGRAVYTTNFTPSTTPLGDVDGTVLLTCQSNSFADNSLARAIPTVNTPANISPVSPFIPTQAYSAASYGGTMYFDGTGDYLTVASIGTMTGDFTYECWIFPLSTAALFLPAQIGSETSGRFYAAINTSRTINLEYFGSGTITLSGATVTANTWNHLAITRSGSTMRGFINGVLAGSTTSLTGTIGNAGSTFIGASSFGTAPINGYISNLRIVNGTALYTTPFVPPVAPFTNISNTKLLLNATNANIYDATGDNVIETVGNAQVSTAVKKWGASSLYFDGTGDWLFVPTSAQFGFGTGAFTVEAWVYPATAFSVIQTIVDSRSSNGATPWLLGISATGLARSYDGTTVRTGGQLTSLAWNHVAWSRTFSGTNYVTVNGVVGHTWSAATDFGATKQLTIGSGVAGYGELLTGYIQDLRITKGVGRYQGAFTPPAAAFAYNQYDICNQQWTPSNISVTAGVGQDNLADSPSNYGTDTGAGGQVRGNYATLDPLRPASYGAAILTNGSLNAAQTTTAYVSSTSTVGVTSGKWYWEVTCGVAGFVTSIGITSNLAANGFTTGMATYHYDGTKYIGATNSAYGAAYTNNDVIGFALDLDAGTLVCYKNGASQGTLTSGLSGTYYAYTTLYGSNNVNFNFGQRAFAYAAPTGFKCLVSTNLPTPTIGATSTTQASDYFNAVLYTGTGATRSVTGVGFQPDLVWVKGRSGATNHGLYDAVRGVQKQIESSTTTAETTQTTGITAFESDGFTMGSLAQLNTNAATYVAWNWKANGAGVSNTAGTIPSTVSANTTAGFSIVTYSITNASSTISTFGHGLGVAPAMVILKVRNSVDEWTVYHNAVSSPNNNWLTLNTTNAAGGSTSTFSSSSTTFGVRETRLVGAGLSGNIVAYCFAPISGFSTMSSYTGNGSTDGPFVFLNYRPAFLLVKRTDTTSNWTTLDFQREGYNVDNDPLFPNLLNAEATTDLADLLSNGFKLRTTDASVNASGGTYVYISLASNPFKYARAR